jgi:hypothetical protein
MALFRFVRKLRSVLSVRSRSLGYYFSTPLGETESTCATGPTRLFFTNRVGQLPLYKQRISKELRAVLVALLFVCAIYLLTSGIPSLFDQVDGQYAGAAREMIARRDWLIPTQDDVP